MLLIEFALGGADDWHVIPLPIAVGAVATVAQLRVLDTFGRVTEIEPVDDGPATGPHWRMFRFTSIDDDTEALPLVLVVPSAGAELLGDPVEDLRLARDEQANLAWAIERVVPDARGDATTVDGGRSRPTRVPSPRRCAPTSCRLRSRPGGRRSSRSRPRTAASSSTAARWPRSRPRSRGGASPSRSSCCGRRRCRARA